MRDLSLFAGAGGGILAGLLLGWQTVAAVELDAYCRSVLALRWPEIALHDDVRTFDGRSLRGAVDVVSGGFPCQDISAAGRGAGIDGDRSGLWSEFARIIGEVEPAFAFVENSPRLRTRGLDRVLGDLSGLGFDAEWTCLRASAVGAPHHRDRLWLLASHPNRQRKLLQAAPRDEERDGAQHGSWWAIEPDVGRVVDGLAAGVHGMFAADVTATERLRAIGNGQVPLVAAVAFAGLAQRFGVKVTL